MFITSIVT